MTLSYKSKQFCKGAPGRFVYTGEYTCILTLVGGIRCTFYVMAQLCLEGHMGNSPACSAPRGPTEWSYSLIHWLLPQCGAT